VKVLVTGHHGYIGSVVAPMLVDAGHEVQGVDAFLYGGCDLAGFAAGTPVPGLERDVRDVGPGDLAGFDAVVHLAALSNDPLGALNREWTEDVNLRGTLALARAAKEAGVERFLFSSSCSMYGAAGQGSIDEDAPLAPLTAYAESKVRAEEGLHELADDSFSPVYMRNATAYGASPRLRLDLVLNNLVGWAHTTGSVRILSDGTPWRPLVHVEDVGRSVLAFLEAPGESVHDEAFNVGADSENYQVRELAETVREVVPGSVVEYAGSGDPDPRSYRVDFSKLARTFPDFRPRWTARTGAEQLLGAYRAARLTSEEFAGSRFTRLKRLEELIANGELDGDLRRR
jgi:nucleoside-diphosphate-sugar epimerase